MFRWKRPSRFLLVFFFFFSPTENLYFTAPVKPSWPQEFQANFGLNDKVFVPPFHNVSAVFHYNWDQSKAQVFTASVPSSSSSCSIYLVSCLLYRYFLSVVRHFLSSALRRGWADSFVRGSTYVCTNSEGLGRIYWWWLRICEMDHTGPGFSRQTSACTIGRPSTSPLEGFSARLRKLFPDSGKPNTTPCNSRFILQRFCYFLVPCSWLITPNAASRSCRSRVVATRASCCSTARESSTSQRNLTLSAVLLLRESARYRLTWVASLLFFLCWHAGVPAIDEIYLTSN